MAALLTTQAYYASPKTFSSHTVRKNELDDTLCVCVCVCVCARARARVYVLCSVFCEFRPGGGGGGKVSVQKSHNRMSENYSYRRHR